VQTWRFGKAHSSGWYLQRLAYPKCPVSKPLWAAAILTCSPTSKENPPDYFDALKKAPGETADPGQLEIVLQGNSRGSLKAGSPVYFRQVQVGEISDYELASSGDAVNIFVIIYKKYVPLVRENSVFFNVSGTWVRQSK
jgi:paraquat-inducible protein B